MAAFAFCFQLSAPCSLSTPMRTFFHIGASACISTGDPFSGRLSDGHPRGCRRGCEASCTPCTSLTCPCCGAVGSVCCSHGVSSSTMFGRKTTKGAGTGGVRCPIDKAVDTEHSLHSPRTA